MGETFPKIVVSQVSQNRQKNFFDRVSKNSLCEGRLRLKRKDGSSFRANTINSVIKDSNGKVIGFLGIFRNIHDLQPVQVSEQRSDSPLSQMPSSSENLHDSYQQVQQLNTHLEHQVQERTAQLEQVLNFESMLKRITDRVRDSLDESQIMQTAVQELTLGLKACCCDFALYDLDQASVTIHYQYPNSTATTHHPTWKTTEFPEIYPQLMQGQCFQFCFNSHPLRGQVAVLACPIFDNQEILGDLWLFHPPEKHFTGWEIRLVQQVANQCAIALRQARLYQAAQAQVKELEKLNRLKDDFLSTVSHELRTPVSNMKMAIHMLRMAPSAERRERYLDILQAECTREAELINDLLDLQRLEAASYPVFLIEAIYLQDWLPKTLNSFRARIQERQQTLEVNILPELPPLISDRASIERIFAELLNNACKYTPAGGKIVLQVHYEASAASGRSGNSSAIEPASSIMVISLSNEVEIPATELPRLFEKFYRVPNSDPWKQGGTGLGLALVQRLVERLKGTIQVESTAGWTTFTLQLPSQPGP